MSLPLENPGSTTDFVNSLPRLKRTVLIVFGDFFNIDASDRNLLIIVGCLLNFIDNNLNMFGYNEQSLETN